MGVNDLDTVNQSSIKEDDITKGGLVIQVATGSVSVLDESTTSLKVPRFLTETNGRYGELMFAIRILMAIEKALS
jgi:hypothetical protein